jgi:hypothetical protein
MLSMVTCPQQDGVPSECRGRGGVLGVLCVDRQTSRQSIRRDESVHYPRRSTDSTTAELEQQCAGLRPIRRFCGRFATVGDSMQTTTLVLRMTAPKKRIGCSWTTSIPSTSFLLRLLASLIAFAQVSAQRNSTKKTTISGLLQTPQSIRHHLMAVSWGFCLIGLPSLQPFVATPSSLAPVPSSLRLLPRPQ